MVRRAVLLLPAGCFTLFVLAGCFIVELAPGLSCVEECPGRQTCLAGKCVAECATAEANDEDGDGLDDGCDPCPHLRGDALDSDDDGVGDACDPAPREGKQRRAFFDAFTPMIREQWNAKLGDGEIRMNPSLNGIVRLRVPTAEHRIVFGGVVEAVLSASSQFGVAFGCDPERKNCYSVGAFRPVVILEEFDTGAQAGNTFCGPQATREPAAGAAWSVQIDESVNLHTIDLTVAHGDAPPEQLHCDTQTIVAHRPLTRGDEISMFIAAIDLRIQYVWIVETLP